MKNFDEYSAHYLSFESKSIISSCLALPYACRVSTYLLANWNYHMPHEEYTKSIQNFLPKLLLRRRILILPGISGFAYGPYLPDKSSSFSHLNGSLFNMICLRFYSDLDRHCLNFSLLVKILSLLLTSKSCGSRVGCHQGLYVIRNVLSASRHQKWLYLLPNVTSL